MEDRKGEHPFGDLGQLVCAAAFLAVWASDSFVFHWSTFLASVVPNAVRMTLLGATLVLTAILLSGSHHVVIGEQRPDYVINTGPFRYVRHPLYLAALLAYLGTALSSLSLLSLALLVPIFLFYDYIAGYEEQLLEMRFGDSYRTYAARTRKWLPMPRRKCGDSTPG